MFYFLLDYWWQFLLLGVGSYLLGAVNFSVTLSRLVKKQDIREEGSGNPGTTNMFRVFGLKMGLLTLLFDALKGAAACLFAKLFYYVEPSTVTFAMYFAGLSAVVGHIFPIYYGLKGGKGFATSLGMLFVVQPILSLISILPLFALIVATDKMSFAAIFYSVFMTLWHWCMLSNGISIPSCVFVSVMFLLVIFAHRKNIVRLVTGRELPTGLRKMLLGKKTKKDAEKDGNVKE